MCVKKVRVSAFFVRVCVAGETQTVSTGPLEKLGVAADVICKIISVFPHSVTIFIT